MLRCIPFYLALVAAALTVPGGTGAWAQFSIPDDPLFVYQWHLNNDAETQGTPNWRSPNGVTDIDWLEAHQTYGAGGSRVIVAVDDTGVSVGPPRAYRFALELPGRWQPLSRGWPSG